MSGAEESASAQLSERARRRGARKGVAVLAFVAAFACSGTALAQALAPPTGGDRFALIMRGQVSHESNVSGGGPIVAALRQISPEDVISSVGGSVTFQLPSSRQTLYLTATGDVQRHQKNKTLDADNYLVSTGATGSFGLCGGSGMASYGRRQSLSTDFTDVTVPVAQNIAETQSVNAGVQCGRRGIGAALQGGITKIANTAKVGGFVDSELRSASATISYQNQSLGDIGLAAQFAEVTYQDIAALRPVPTAQTDGFKQYGLGLKYARKIGKRLNGTVNVTYAVLDLDTAPLSPTAPAPPVGAMTKLKSNSINANAALQYQLGSRTNISLDYTLDNQASTAVNAAYVRGESLRMSGSYSLNPRISVQGGLGQSKTHYIGGLPSPTQLRDSRELTVSGGLNIKVGRKVSIFLDAGHSERKADNPLFDFTSNRVSLGITGTF